MSEKKPGYNPEGLTEEELRQIDEEAAKERARLLENKIAEAKENAQFAPKKLLNVKGPKWQLPTKHREGFRTHEHKLPRTKEEIEEDAEDEVKELRGAIQKLLKQFKVKGRFILKPIKDRYSFYLSVKHSKSSRYEEVLDFEDETGKIVPRLQDYLENTYDRL